MINVIIHDVFKQTSLPSLKYHIVPTFTFFFSVLGHSVRNIQAFAVLQNAFLKAKTSFLAQIILDAITNIYMADNANYFILESQHTLSQFAEKISKLPEVQNKYFEMLEFVVFSLNYIPCKELISVSILLKSSSSYHCSIIAMKTLLKFTRHDYIFKDVFREVGLLEVMVNLLHKYAALLKDPTQAQNEQGKILSVILFSFEKGFKAESFLFVFPFFGYWIQWLPNVYYCDISELYFPKFTGSFNLC